MKKDLSNLINIDIKNKLLKYYKYAVCIASILVFTSCDNIESPSWQTQINLPLISSDFLFSDMLGEGIINNKDRIAQMVLTPIINIEFEETNELPESIRDKEGFGSTGK